MVPDAGMRVWTLFWAMERRRQGTGYGANAISHQEIEAASRLRGMELRSWEVRALDEMEAARMEWYARSRDEEELIPLTPNSFSDAFNEDGKK